MLTQQEIETIVVDLLNRLGFTSPLVNWLRDLDTRRIHLRREESLEISENLATVLIQKVAKIQKRLVQETELRLEEELNVAIESAIQAIIEWDYDRATDGLPNLSDSS